MISQLFIRKTCLIVCYSQVIPGDQRRRRPAQYLFYFFQIISFYVDHSLYRHANNLGEGYWRPMAVAKCLDQEIGALSRKNAITHPLSQIPGYATGYFTAVYQLKRLP